MVNTPPCPSGAMSSHPIVAPSCPLEVASLIYSSQFPPLHHLM